jgi:hypothetical protein
VKTLSAPRGGFLVPVVAAADSPIERLLARERVAFMESPPRGSEAVDLERVIARVRGLSEEIAAHLVTMEEEIQLALVALLAGENVFLLSLPGAAKTTPPVRP